VLYQVGILKSQFAAQCVFFLLYFFYIFFFCMCHLSRASRMFERGMDKRNIKEIHLFIQNKEIYVFIERGICVYSKKYMCLFKKIHVFIRTNICIYSKKYTCLFKEVYVFIQRNTCVYSKKYMC